MFYEWREDVGLIRMYCCLGEEWMDHQGSGIRGLYMRFSIHITDKNCCMNNLSVLSTFLCLIH